MHWLKYIRCKTSIEQDLTFCGLFTSLFSRSVYQDDFFCEFYEPFCIIVFGPAASLSIGQLFILIGTFPAIVAKSTQTRPVREKQFDRRD